MPPPTSAINISDPRPTSPLRRVSTHTSASDKYDPSVASRNRFSRDCSFIEDALQEGDTFGPGLSLQDEPVHLVELPAPPYHVPDQPAQHFKVIRKLGAGSYAVVYLVRELLDVKENRLGREYAVKCLSKVGLDAEALQAQMLEATIQQALPPHPNVATLYRTLQTQSYLLLIQEYVPGEDLFYFLEQARDHEDFDNQSFGTPPTPSLLASLHPSQLLSDRRLRLIASMFSQMCEAVASCHRAQVFHRDIKPENFIVTDGQIPGASGDYERHVVVKLTDFGLATRDVESSDVDCGSAPYMSYECRNNIAPTYTTAPADVWSLGVVLLNMLYHHNPWGDTNRGACQSFTFYLQDPIAFFMQRFPGMTPAVAQFFAQRVFCILDPSKPPRITAHEFGLWARNLPRHLGAQSRRNPNIAFQMAAAASSATPTPAPRSRPTGDILGIHDATTGASYRDKAPPPLSTLPPVQQPVFSTGDLSDGESDYDDAASAGAKSRSRDGKRRKRAARGKGSNNASAIQTPTTANGTPLYTPDDDNLAQLASATQSRAREISNAIAHSRGTSIATSLSNPSFQSTTTVNTVSTTTTTTTTTQVIKKKKSSKWGDIFRRDSGSDQEFVSDYLNSTSVGDNRMAANIHDSLSSSSVLPAPAPAPSARAQQVTNIILGLNPQMPSEAPPKAKVTAQDGSVRGRKKNKVMDDADSRRRAPSAPASADRSWRDKSTERIHHTHLPANYPPVPELPPHYRQTNAAPSNVSVSTTTSSSVLTTPHARSTSFLHQSPQSPPTSSVVSNPWDGPYAPKSAAPSIRSMAPSVMSTSTYSSSASSNWRSSASSKYAGSVRSVSTAATSVSSGSNWRERGTRQTNIKQMDGVPWELDEMPRQMSHRPKEHKFKPPPPSANPSDSKRRAGISSSKPGSGGVPPLPPLDTINERYKGGGGTGFSPVNESPVESIGALEGAPKSAGASKSKLWPRWGRK